MLTLVCVVIPVLMGSMFFASTEIRKCAHRNLSNMNEQAG